MKKILVSLPWCIAFCLIMVSLEGHTVTQVLAVGLGMTVSLLELLMQLRRE